MKDAQRQDWTRDELILALDLYRRLEGRIPDVRDAEVGALSSLLAELAMIRDDSEGRTGRSRAAVIFKLSNLRALDSAATDAGKAGFGHVGALDREVWDQYADDPRALKRAVDGIEEKVRAARAEVEPLRANLHVLRLLGDELIGSPRLAVFELVKNAYDADAEAVTVRLELDTPNPSISVQDDGSGMSLDTIRAGWLQIGSPLKRQVGRIPSPRFGRTPLGEKGVGRLAAFKLGNRLELNTRTRGATEYRLVMDLDAILANPELGSDSSVEDVRVRVTRLEKPVVFPGDLDHGTLIRITKLRPELDWKRGPLRELCRLVASLSSPFEEIGQFRTELLVPGREQELRDIPDVRSLLDRAMWEFHFRIDDDGRYHWTFRFNPPPVFRKLIPREVVSDPASREGVLLVARSNDPEIPSRPQRGSLHYSREDLAGIGPISGSFYVFDLRGTVLKHLGAKAVKTMLEYQGGVRVFRDGIRVFNYGEPGDDWLELNLKRVNKPAEKLATNSVVAAIHLSLEKSRGLREKTNREGFDHNAEFERFKAIVNAVVEHLNSLRQPDRDRIDKLLRGDSLREDAPTRFRKAVDDVLSIARDKGAGDQIAGPMERIVREYETLRDVVASSGAGLNLAIVFHEVEREVHAIASGLDKGEDMATLKLRADNLAEILDGFGSLLRNASSRTMPVSVLVKRAVQLNRSRFEAHCIVCSTPVLEGIDEDFEASGAFSFYLQALMNLIDNAIYWVRRRGELEGKDFHRAIQIRTLLSWAADGPSLAVLDNGPGFAINPEEAMRAFASTRPGGMGLGLYFARTAMEANGGDLLIPASIDDLETDSPLKGAAVVMRFRRIRK